MGQVWLAEQEEHSNEKHRNIESSVEERCGHTRSSTWSSLASFDAPVERVWKAWIDPQQVMQWWGPDHFTSPSAQIDFREGGISLVCMRAPKEFGGQDMYSTWAYMKIVPLQSIEYIHNLADKNGKKVDPVKLGMPSDFPQDQRSQGRASPPATIHGGGSSLPAAGDSPYLCRSGVLAARRRAGGQPAGPAGSVATRRVGRPPDSASKHRRGGRGSARPSSAGRPYLLAP